MRFGFPCLYPSLEYERSCGGCTAQGNANMEPVHVTEVIGLRQVQL
jgi:hypothetical protein